MLHGLTYPSNPNLEIPPSPTGLPALEMNQKCDYFLQLKSRDVHFNEKLAQSSALQNPSVLERLVKSTGLKEEDQYTATLPQDLWDPFGFPKWSYREDLAKKQRIVVQKTKENRNWLQ